MSAREEVLGRVRAALASVEADTGPVTAPQRSAVADVVEHFVERVADYRAEVVQCSILDLEATIAAVLPSGARVVVPPGLGSAVPGAVPDAETSPLSAVELDAFDAVVTACRIAVAETGTIVLDHAADQGRRAITLVPDRHVCIVRADQVVLDVADALPVLEPGRPQTWISGPSATSDIELTRVEGVHGPRHLTVVVVTGGDARG